MQKKLVLFLQPREYLFNTLTNTDWHAKVISNNQLQNEFNEPKKLSFS